jgi:hypothetical protein
MCKTCKTCFRADTLITLDNIEYPIYQIKDVIVSQTTEMISLRFEHDTVDVTPTHLIKSVKGYIPVEELVLGDLVTTSSGKNERLISMSRTESVTPIKVYNLDLGGDDIQVGKSKILFSDCTLDQFVFPTSVSSYTDY